MAGADRVRRVVGDEGKEQGARYAGRCSHWKGLWRALIRVTWSDLCFKRVNQLLGKD